MTTIKVPISYEDLKASLRNGISNEYRESLWQVLPLLTEGQPIDSFPNISELVKKSTLKSGVQFNGEKLILSKVLERKDLVYDSSLVMDIEEILSSVIKRQDVCYFVLTTLLENEYKYLSRNMGGVIRRMYTFRVLLSYYMPKTYDSLEKLGALDDKYLSIIFLSYFKNLLPLSITQHIIDSFLLEGVKIIYRYGLALFRMHKSMIKLGEFRTAELFWDYVASYSLSPSAEQMLIHYAFDSDRHAVQKVMRPMKIGRDALQSIDVLAKNSISHISDRIDMYTPIHLRMNNDVAPSNGNKGRFNVVPELWRTSELINAEYTEQLFSFLPDYVRFVNFKLTFSTSTNGYNLETLYECCVDRKPCIILVKGARLNEIVGGYIHSTISPPSNNVRGDGTAVCFRLDKSGGVGYKWTGLKGDFDENPEDSKYLAKVQFALFSKEYFAFGASATNGSNALRVDKDMRICHCGNSDTFDNPPLLNEGNPFEIETIEVYCG